MVPAKRLVGIELNPGPPPSTTKGRKRPRRRSAPVALTKRANDHGSMLANLPRSTRVSDPSVTRLHQLQALGALGSIAQVRGPRGLQRGMGGALAFNRPPSAADYIRCLERPFSSPAPKLGFSTFVPTGKSPLWKLTPAFQFSTGNTFTCFAVVASITTALDAIRVCAAATSNLTLTSTVQFVDRFTNAASVSTSAQWGRVINGGLRVKVRLPSSFIPGTLGGILLPLESTTSVYSLSYQSLAALEGFVPFLQESDGVIGGEVSFRPADVDSFGFQGDLVGSLNTPATTSRCQLVIVGLGWPPAPSGTFSAFSLEMDVKGHLETLGGVDQFGYDDNEPSLVTSGMSMDLAGAAARAADIPVVPSISLMESLDNGINNINRSLGRTTFGGARAGYGRLGTPVVRPQAMTSEHNLSPPPVQSLPGISDASRERDRYIYVEAKH